VTLSDFKVMSGTASIFSARKHLPDLFFAIHCE